jgi:tRNA pseudouridine55 synthase
MNAFLAIDKEAGISSFGVISKLRKILKMRKIGHCGTLDPFATGLLICATGQYTRLLRFAEASHKCYEAEVLLGERSATGDPEGEIIATMPVNICPEDWDSLTGKVLALKELPIPQYSAVKIEGRRAYNLAREGKNPQMPTRAVEILDFQLLSEVHNNRFRYRAVVSKGTYIRSLSEYIAAALGTLGTTIALRRTSIGNIDLAQAQTLDSIAKSPELISERQILEGLASVEVPEPTAAMFLNGMKSPLDLADNEEMAIYGSYDRLLGIGSIRDSQLIPKIVINGA